MLIKVGVFLISSLIFPQVPQTAEGRLIAVRTPDPREGLSCPSPENGQFSHPKYCDKYLSCWDGELVVVGQCPNGLVFNQNTNACDYPRNVDCGDREVSRPTSTGNSGCPRPDGTFASPSNCSQFIVCQGGNFSLYSCPDDLHYNSELGVCMYPKDAGCQQMETPDESSQGSNQSSASTGSPASSTTPTIPSSSQFPTMKPQTTQSPSTPASTVDVPILTPGPPTIDPGAVQGPPQQPTPSTTTTTTPRPSDIDQILWPAWPNWPTAKCPIIQGMLPVLGDCEAVVVCLGGIGHFFRCPRGHAFDVSIGKCGPIRVTEGCQQHQFPEDDEKRNNAHDMAKKGNKVTNFMMNPFASQINFAGQIDTMAALDHRPWLALRGRQDDFSFPREIRLAPESSKLVIGRQTDNDVILPYPWISRKHCQLEVDEKQKCILTSLSTNGMIVNSILLLQGSSKELEDLDEIEFVAPPPVSRILYVFHPSSGQLMTSGSISHGTRSNHPDVQAPLDKDNLNYSDMQKKPEEIDAVGRWPLDKSSSSCTDSFSSVDHSVDMSDLEGEEHEEIIHRRFLRFQERINYMETRNAKLRASGAEKVGELKTQLELAEKKNATKQADTFDRIYKIVQESFSCGLCNRVLVQCQILSCGDSFCKSCLDQVPPDSRRCPTCQHRIDLAAHLRAADNYLDSIHQLLPHSVQEAREVDLHKRKVNPGSLPSTQESDSVIFLGTESYEDSTLPSDNSQGIEIIFEQLVDDEEAELI